MDFDKTMNFSVERDKNIKTREVLKQVYSALQKKDTIQLIKLLDIFYLETQLI